MKSQSFKILLAAILSVCCLSVSFAQGDNLWTCKTNASSAAAGSEDAQADINMSKKPMEGNDAFGFAFQHCRNCTSITCTKQK